MWRIITIGFFGEVIFFCYDEGHIVILFNGFQKKMQKTPDREIDKALKLKKEYYERKRTKDV